MLTCHGFDLFQHTPHRWLICLGSGEIWRPLWSSSCYSCAGFVVCEGVSSCRWGGPPPWGVGTWSKTLFGWVVWCQDPRFPCYSHDPGATWVWFSVSVPLSGWTGHNCMCIRGYLVTTSACERSVRGAERVLIQRPERWLRFALVPLRYQSPRV